MYECCAVLLCLINNIKKFYIYIKILCILYKYNSRVLVTVILGIQLYSNNHITSQSTSFKSIW